MLPGGQPAGQVDRRSEAQASPAVFAGHWPQVHGELRHGRGTPGRLGRDAKSPDPNPAPPVDPPEVTDLAHAACAPEPNPNGHRTGRSPAWFRRQFNAQNRSRAAPPKYPWSRHFGGTHPQSTTLQQSIPDRTDDWLQLLRPRTGGTAFRAVRALTLWDLGTSFSTCPAPLARSSICLFISDRRSHSSLVSRGPQMPTISVVVPAMNEAENLPTCCRGSPAKSMK